jgi:hypothetical protein
MFEVDLYKVFFFHMIKRFSIRKHANSYANGIECLIVDSKRNKGDHAMSMRIFILYFRLEAREGN